MEPGNKILLTGHSQFYSVTKPQQVSTVSADHYTQTGLKKSAGTNNAALFEMGEKNSSGHGLKKKTNFRSVEWR